MCNVVSSRLIIGNYIIESVKKDSYRFNLDDFCRYDSILDEELKKIDYCSDFDKDELFDFADDYPFVVNDEADTLSIVQDLSKDVFLKMLDRYFRIGVSRDVALALEDASKVYWRSLA